MTHARKAALQWLHDHGEFCLGRYDPSQPSVSMRTRMMNGGEMTERQDGGSFWLSLTDKGRQRLHEAA